MTSREKVMTKYLKVEFVKNTQLIKDFEKKIKDDKEQIKILVERNFTIESMFGKLL